MTRSLFLPFWQSLVGKNKNKKRIGSSRSYDVLPPHSVIELPFVCHFDSWFALCVAPVNAQFRFFRDVIGDFSLRGFVAPFIARYVCGGQ
jgi:hypothetical protein